MSKLRKRKVQNSMQLNPMNTTGEKLHVFSQQSAAPLSPRKLETQKTQAPNMKPHKKQWIAHKNTLQHWTLESWIPKNTNPWHETTQNMENFWQQSAAPMNPRKLETLKTQAPNMKPYKEL